MTGTPPPKTTRIGAPPAATRIGGERAASATPAPPAPRPIATTLRLDDPTPPAATRTPVTGIAGQRRQRVSVTPDGARGVLAAAGVAPPDGPLLDAAIARFDTLLWSVDHPAKLADEAEQIGQAAQRVLRLHCDAMLALQQSRHAADLARHLGRIHDLLAAVGARMAGAGVRNAVLDWMGGEVLPAAVESELRLLQQEVGRLQAPVDAELAALVRGEAEAAGLDAEIAAWGIACHLTTLVPAGDAPPALARVTHLRLESLLRSQALAVQQRQVLSQQVEHLRALRARAHDAVLTDLPAWLGAVAAVQSRGNPTQRYSLRTQLQSLTDRLVG